MKFSKTLVEDIYKKVKNEGWHPMSAVRALGEAWGYSRNDRRELFETYMEYCRYREN